MRNQSGEHVADVGQFSRRARRTFDRGEIASYHFVKFPKRGAVFGSAAKFYFVESCGNNSFPHFFRRHCLCSIYYKPGTHFICHSVYFVYNGLRK